MRPHKILFCFYSLSYIGGERLSLSLANYLADFYDVHIYAVRESNKLNSLISNKITHIKSEDQLANDYDVEVATCEYKQIDFLLKRNSIAKKIILFQTVGWSRYNTNKAESYFENIDKFDKFVFVSEFQYNSFLNTFKNVDKQKLFVNHIKLNKDNIQALSQETCVKFDNAFCICNVGRISNDKNLTETIDIVDNLSKKYNVHLLLLGSGDCESQISRIISERELTDIVDIIPFDINPYKYMFNSDLIISTSNYESFGLTMLEGILLNKLVITNNNPAKSEVLQNGKLGIIYNSIDEAINIIEELIENKYDIVNVKQNIEEFNNNYDSEEMFINFKNIINEIS